MVCPNCKQKAMRYAEYVFLNPLEEFECRSCGARLKAGRVVKIMLMITFVALMASFVYTFPMIDKVIESQSGCFGHGILRMFFPYVVIALQAVVFFIPVSLYAWMWGRLEIVKK